MLISIHQSVLGICRYACWQKLLALGIKDLRPSNVPNSKFQVYPYHFGLGFILLLFKLSLFNTALCNKKIKVWSVKIFQLYYLYLVLSFGTKITLDLGKVIIQNTQEFAQLLLLGDVVNSFWKKLASRPWVKNNLLNKRYPFPIFYQTNINMFFYKTLFSYNKRSKTFVRC